MSSVGILLANLRSLFGALATSKLFSSRKAESGSIAQPVRALHLTCHFFPVASDICVCYSADPTNDLPLLLLQHAVIKDNYDITVTDINKIMSSQLFQQTQHSHANAKRQKMIRGTKLYCTRTKLRNFFYR